MGGHADAGRGQVEPTVALVSLLAVCLGLSLYAVVLAGAAPAPTRDVAGPTLARVRDALAAAGVADPVRLGAARDAGPAGYALNVSLSAAGQSWAGGPSPPPGADTASASLPVRTAPGRVRAGNLRVAVWGAGGGA